MKGDYSRVPYNPADNITRVLFQQGRPLVEADLNEALTVLQANQEMLIGLHAKAPNASSVIVPFSPEPFLVQKESFIVTTGNQLSVGAGAIAFDGLFLRSRTTRPLARFRKISLSPLGGYLVTNDAQDLEKVDNATYVLAVAANERQMLLSEIDARHSDAVQFRAANLWTIDWHFVFVPVPDTDGTAGIVAQEVTNLRDSLKTLNVHGDPPPIQINIKEADKARFSGRILRLEVHETKEVSGKQKVTLKLALDNASHSFRVEPSNRSGITFLPVGIDHSDFPKKDDSVEVETLRFVDWIDGKPNKLLKVTNDPDGTELFVRETIKLEPADQIRRWSYVFADKEITDINPLGVPGVLYSVTSKIADGLELQVIVRNPSELVAGDAWSFKTDGFTANGADWMSSDWISGFRKRQFFAAIGAFTYNGTLWTAADGNEDVRNALTALSPTHTEQLPQVDIRPSRRGALTHVSVASYVNDVTVSRFFPKASTIAMRKWLASATWGELVGLSTSDLRDRVLRDCDKQGCPNDQLEADLRMVLSHRQKLVNSDIALA